jgi:uncharacterized protein
MMIDHIRSEVTELLAADKSGHSIDHVDRVHRLSLELAEKEAADPEIVSLIALLHDVDDYKLFGAKSARELTNATTILNRHQVDQKIAHQVLTSISSMGYNHYLDGVRPKLLEGQIVSDADMCDALGAMGILRTYAFNNSKGRAFFDKEITPVTGGLTGDQYRTSSTEHAVQHFFDKLLLIPGILLTEAGREEGEKRITVMIDFLDELFREEGATVWQEHLHQFRIQIGR